MRNLEQPRPYHASAAELYVVANDPSGPWRDRWGQPCHLVSVNKLGEPRWMVSPVSLVGPDRAAAAHYALEIWPYSGRQDRRRRDRRAGAERTVGSDHDDRNGGNRRGADRRGADRRVAHRRGLEARQSATVRNLGERTDRRAIHRRRAELVKAGAAR
jgi:hypothetical protein